MTENKALYRRWRPQSFADLVGQNHVKQTILNAIRAGKVSHAYLFAGPHGTGKTSLARLLAKAVNCLDNQNGDPCGKCANCVALAEGKMMDLIEIDAASHTSVDDVRALIEKVNFTPSVAKYKVYLIDEVHMLSKSAFNALLKTLEEPPAHAIFILATTEVHKLPATVISRCQYFDFHYLTHQEVAEQLKKIAKQEQVQIDDEALNIIADNAEGSLRDAISMMDQAVSYSDGKVDKVILKDLLGIVDTKIVRDLTGAIIDKDALTGINLINNSYFKGYDLNQLSKSWINYLRELLMVKLGNEKLVFKSTDEKAAMAKQAGVLSVGGIINLLQRLIEATNQYKVASLPQLALEMVVAKSCNDAEKVVSVKPVPVAVAAMSNPITPPVPVAAAPTVPTKLSPEILTDLKEQLCAGIGAASPSLGAVIKTCQLKIVSGKLQLVVPSKFLKDNLDKLINKNLLTEQLTKRGLIGVEIECVVEIGSNPVEIVAGVFDIM